MSNARNLANLLGTSATVPSAKLATIDVGKMPTPFIGMIIPFPTSSLPTGFLACDGSAVSRSTYSALFGVVSTTYGTGDGSSTFNVPDLRAAFLRGSGDQTYSSIAYSGGTVGTKKIQSIMNHQARTRHTYHNYYAWSDICLLYTSPSPRDRG